MNLVAQYRPAVGIMLLNRAGEIFVGRRLDMPAGQPAWQMPQGGIDEGETPRQAALRELVEETGVYQAEFLAESRVWRHYDLPPEIAARMWGGRYRGQRQKWFAMRFTGADSAIDLNVAQPEFDAWEWVSPARLLALIVPFKRQIYSEIAAEFAAYCGAPPVP